jgi:hypothetical protein
MTYTLIAHTELGSAAAEVTFSSIPATFTDLLLVFSTRSAFRQDTSVKFNGSTANFSDRYLIGTGSSVFTGTSPANFLGVLTGSGDTANTFASGQLYIPNYRGSALKSWSVDSVGENNATAAYQNVIAGLWNLTDAITSITIFQTNGDNLGQYTSATLYGITSGSSGGVVVS